MRTALFATVPGRLSLPLLGLPKATPLRISTFEIIQRKVGLGSWAVNLELVHKERRDPVWGIWCAPLQQSGRDDGKAFAVEHADRRDQSEDETYWENKIYWPIGSSLTEPWSGFGMTSTAAFSVSNHRLP